MDFKAILFASVLLVVTTQTSANRDAGCTLPAVQHFQSCYWQIPANNWNDANDVCISQNAELASFHNIQQIDAFAELDGFSIVNNGQKFWVGMARRTNKWRWLEFSGNQIHNAYWGNNEKNGWRNGEDCVSGLKYSAALEWEWSSENCDIVRPGICQGELEEAEVGGDPHFIISSRDQSNTHLCYDVTGEQDEVLLLLKDSQNDLTVNGAIFKSDAGVTDQTFFSDITVLFKDYTVKATRNGITVNDIEHLVWGEDFLVSLTPDAESTVESTPGGIVFDINLSSDISLQVTRTMMTDGGYYLGFSVSDGEGISSTASGLIGTFMRSSFSVSYSSQSRDGFMTFIGQDISIPVVMGEIYSHAHRGMIDCWHYTVDNGPSDSLLGKRADYIVSSLTYKTGSPTVESF